MTPTSKSVTVNGANVASTNFTAAVGAAHSVDLSWTASTSSGVSGYKVYRSTTSGSGYALQTSAPVTSTIYKDVNVAAGTTYYYVVRSVNSSGTESANSNQATAAVPTP
jgi:fibronectin type 3 domain-containing protein